MKRIVVAVLLILTLSVSVVYASGFEVEIRAVPYEIQKYVRIKSDYSITSVQGFGGQTGVKFVTDLGFMAGVEIGIDSCTYDVGDSYRTNFDGTLHGKLGLATPIDTRVGFELGLGFGFDMNSDPEEGLQIYPSAMANLGLRLKCLPNTDGFALSFGAALKLDWEMDVWLAYAFTPYFGIDYKF